MTRFNTGNQIPSISEEDAYDNMANLDRAMNSTDPTWRDRFNVEKPTIDAALKSAGFMPAGFDFVTGGTLQPGDRNKCVYNPTPNGDNNWYRWNGVFPKEIAANSQPNPKDGNNWVPVIIKTGVVEREALRRTYQEVGLNLVEGSFEQGGVITSTTDVVLHEKTGKCYSGPVGNVPKGTNPLSGGFELVEKVVSVVFTDTAFLRDSKYNPGSLIIISDRGNGVFLLEQGTEYNNATTIKAGDGLIGRLQVYNNVITSDNLGIKQNQDITELLKDIAEDIKHLSVVSIVMKVDAVFNGVLPYEYNMVSFSPDPLTGVGRLKINDTKNIIQALPNIKSPYKNYSGKLNGMFLDNQNTKSAIKVRKDIRVVLLGDSIGVTSDWDSHAVSPGARSARGVDNFSSVNSLGFLLFQEICLAVGSDVRVKFYSRCVGGKSYVNLGNSWDSQGLQADWGGREQVTPGKAWVDCVLDLEPDLVIHSMGMNHSPTDYIDSFYNQWVLKLIGTGRLDTFDQAIISTPSPNFENAGQFGDFRNFCTPMFFLGHQQRYLSKRYGITLIDVSFYSFLKRYGIDPRSSAISKGYADIKIKNNVLTTLPPGSNERLTHPNNPIFHQTTFTLNHGSNDLDFRINFGDGVIVQFNNNNVSIVNGVFGTFNTTKTRIFPIPQNTDLTFTIQVLPQGVYLFSGEDGSDLLLVNNVNAYQSTVDCFAQNKSVSGDAVIKNIKIYEGEFPRYSGDTSTTEVYGVLDYKQNPFGGGINHPSTKGLTEIYLPPIREFCNSLMKGDYGSYVHNYRTMQDGDLVYIGSIELLPSNISSFNDLTSGIGFKVTVNGGGGISFENNTGLSIYYNVRGDIYLELGRGKKISNMCYEGCWRKYGGHVVDKAHAPLRLRGFNSVPYNVPQSFTVRNGIKYTRTDILTITAGKNHNLSFDLGDCLVTGAQAVITAEGETANLTARTDVTNVTTSSKSGKVSYIFTLTPAGETINRRILVETSFIVK